VWDLSQAAPHLLQRNQLQSPLVPSQQPHLFSASPQYAPSPLYQQGNVAAHANQFAAAGNAMPLPQFGAGPSFVDGHRLPPSAAFDGHAASGAAGGDGNTEKVLLPYGAASVAQVEKQLLLPGAPQRSELAAPGAVDTNLKAKTKQQRTPTYAVDALLTPKATVAYADAQLTLNMLTEQPHTT
jgi:hypothetical protein